MPCEEGRGYEGEGNARDPSGGKVNILDENKYYVRSTNFNYSRK